MCILEFHFCDENENAKIREQKINVILSWGGFWLMQQTVNMQTGRRKHTG